MKRFQVKPILNPTISPQNIESVLRLAAEIFNYDGRQEGFVLPTKFKFELLMTNGMIRQPQGIVRNSVRSLGGWCTTVEMHKIKNLSQLNYPRFFWIKSAFEQNQLADRNDIFHIYFSPEQMPFSSMLERFLNKVDCDRPWSNIDIRQECLFVLCQAVWLFQFGYQSFGDRFSKPTIPTLSLRRTPQRTLPRKSSRTNSTPRPSPSPPVASTTATPPRDHQVGIASGSAKKPQKQPIQIVFPDANCSVEEKIECLAQLEKHFVQLSQDPIHNLEKLRCLARYFDKMNQDKNSTIRDVIRDFPDRVRPGLFDFARSHWIRVRALRDRELPASDRIKAEDILKIYKFILENIPPQKWDISAWISYLEHLLRSDIRTHCWKCKEEFWRSERPYCPKCNGNICFTASCKSCLCSYRRWKLSD